MIVTIDYAWRAGEKLLRRRFPAKEHYLIMKAFRCLSRHYPVTIAYPNPVSTGSQAITIKLDLCENSQDWYFRQKDRYEQDWVRVISFGMNNADSFIDVGAHIGVYALSMAQAYPDKRVVAIEPLPSNYSRLEENVQANGLSNVELHQAVISDVAGSVRVYVNPINDGGGSMIQTNVYRTGDVKIDALQYQRQHPDFAPVVVARAMSLDDVITGASVLKIDVEGAELLVLRSGESSLNDGKIDLIVVEVTAESIGEILEFLAKAGFDCFYRGESSPISDVALLPRGLDNILCLRKGSPAYGAVLSKATVAIS